MAVAASGELWTVVGGGAKGGLAVRGGSDLSAPELGELLATGAVVKALEREDGRLRFELVEGEGPATGWVSTSFKGKERFVQSWRKGTFFRRSAAEIVATFEELLGTVEAAVDELLSRGMAERDQLQQTLATQLTPVGDLTLSETLTRRLLQKFSQSVTAFLGAAVGDYGFLATAVRSAGEALGRGLRAAGQKPLDDMLNATLSSGGLWLEDLRSQLTSLEGESWPRGASRPRPVWAASCSPPRGVCSASESISKFVNLFQRGFLDVSDHLTDAVASRLPADMTAKIYEATSAIQHSVGSIVWKLKSAKRELVLGVNQEESPTSRTP
ncbi:unnamed protein product [Prorocentrum cordatum]|uniref:SH3 domain-containing protein n=1 Tax=Prorocentrum cordatum TaxID=2364126 RepID=A0ABN9SEA9_9DINO|nr:unnamed protein product [Polarella glacialis]